MVSASNIMDFLVGCAFIFLAFPFGLSIWHLSARCFMSSQNAVWVVGRVVMLFQCVYLYIVFFANILNWTPCPGETRDSRAFALGGLVGLVLFALTVRKGQVGHKKRATDKWNYNEIPEIIGQSRDVMVRCRPFPYRQKQNSSTRRYAYPDFGADFRHELMDVQLQDWGELSAILCQNGKVDIHVKLEQCEDILVQIQCNKLPTQQQFFSDLSDAIIDAMRKNNIRI